MLKIIDFCENHIDQAKNISIENFNNAKKSIQFLPKINELPDFLPLTKNNLGVSAFDDEKPIGYLCCYGPWDNAFATSKAKGIWSPLHGNGLFENRYRNVYSKMYQEASKKWVNLGITSHAITYYTHNSDIKNQLFRYGFGLRCIDAIRLTEEIDVIKNCDIDFMELEYENFSKIIPLDKLLRDHLKNSPTFLCYEIGEEDKDNQIKRVIQNNFRYFVAKRNNEIIAYIKITDEGENFITEQNCVKNICGAYCISEYRGKNIIQNLLNYVLIIIKNEKIVLLGLILKVLTRLHLDFG